jgi:hypothetical protein
MNSAAKSGAKLTATKSQKKLMRMILWISLGTLFLAGGTVASAFLWQQTDPPKAILLFVVALAGAGGCVYSFYRCLREISSKPKPPFISTLP